MTYYKAIKLKNGELMAGEVGQDMDLIHALSHPTLTITNPVSFNSFKFMDPEGELVETISMMPLIPITDTEELELSTDHIFSMATMRPAAAERYRSFLIHLREVQEEEAREDAAEQQQQEQEQEETQATDNVVIGQFTNKNYH